MAIQQSGMRTGEAREVIRGMMRDFDKHTAGKDALKATHGVAYNNAVKADGVWMREIKKAFPNERAGDVRYESKAAGYKGTSLRAAHGAYEQANNALRDAVKALMS